MAMHIFAANAKPRQTTSGYDAWSGGPQPVSVGTEGNSGMATAPVTIYDWATTFGGAQQDLDPGPATVYSLSDAQRRELRKRFGATALLGAPAEGL